MERVDEEEGAVFVEPTRRSKQAKDRCPQPKGRKVPHN